MARWTEEEYQALKKAYAMGVRRVKYEDRDVEYESRADMQAKLREAEAELGLTAGRSMRILPSTRTGL